MKFLILALVFLTPWAYAQVYEDVSSFYPAGTPSSAECNGIPSGASSSGPADLAAFNAAAAAAHSSYATPTSANFNVPVKIFFQGNCILSGTVYMCGGEQFQAIGGGVITVPTQTGYTFLATNADNVAWDNIIFNVTNSPGGDNGGQNVIQWISTGSDSLSHAHVYARNNVINKIGERSAAPRSNGLNHEAK